MSNTNKNQIKISLLTLCNIILTFGSTASAGFLSFAGASALGFGFSFSIISAFLTAIVCVAVNWSLIDEAFDRLFDINGKDPHTNIWLKISFLIASILAAISFSATTLISAIPLCALIPVFTPNMALLISGISSIAYFFITYSTLYYTLERFNKFYQKVKNKKLVFNLQDNKLSYTIIGIVFASCVFLLFSTADTWWYGTLQGLQLLLSLRSATLLSVFTVPFSIIQATCFNFTYAIEASRKLLKSNLTASIYKPFIDYLNYVKKDTGLKYNVFYHLSTFLAKTTAWTLFIAHAGAHGLMAGRASLSTIAGTIVDFFADAHFTVASPNYINKPPSVTIASQRKKYARKHHHGAFDLIVVCCQTVITSVLQVPAVTYNYLMSSNAKSFSACLKEGFYFIDDYLNHCNHDHHHHNHHAPTEVPGAVAKDTIDSGSVMAKLLPQAQAPAASHINTKDPAIKEDYLERPAAKP